MRFASYLFVAVAALAIGSLASSPAEAHGRGFAFRGSSVNVNVNGGFVPQRQVIVQQNRGLFGRVRSSTTIISR